jgi:hypothetical protein
MKLSEQLVTVLKAAENLVFEQTFSVEVIDEKTGLVESTITMAAGTYLVYDNFDLAQAGIIRRFVEDPNPSFNHLLRLPERSLA